MYLALFNTLYCWFNIFLKKYKTSSKFIKIQPSYTTLTQLVTLAIFSIEHTQQFNQAIRSKYQKYFSILLVSSFFLHWLYFRILLIMQKAETLSQVIELSWLGRNHCIAQASKWKVSFAQHMLMSIRGAHTLTRTQIHRHTQADIKVFARDWRTAIEISIWHCA